MLRLLHALLLALPALCVAQEACTLCYGGADPSYPDQVINSTTGLNCSDFGTYANRVDLEGPSCTNFYQAWGFLACGCEQPPLPASPDCTLCHDGSPPPMADYIVIPAYNATCSDYDAFVQFTTTPDDCPDVQAQSDVLCGCPSAPDGTIEPTATPSPSAAPQTSDPTLAPQTLAPTLAPTAAPPSAASPSAAPTTFTSTLVPTFAPPSTLAPTNPPCDLCHDGTFPGAFSTFLITSQGTFSCLELAVNNTIMPSGQCSKLQSVAYSWCWCGGEWPIEYSKEPTAAPTPTDTDMPTAAPTPIPTDTPTAASSTPIPTDTPTSTPLRDTILTVAPTAADATEAPTAASNPSSCALCNDGTFPGATRVTLITSAGNYSCQEFALQGVDLSDLECGLLQDKAYDPCQCGQEWPTPSAAPVGIGCPICELVAAPRYPNRIISLDNQDYTCAELVNGTADSLINAAACPGVQNFTQVVCGCNTEAPTAAPVPTPPPTSGPLTWYFPTSAPTDVPVTRRRELETSSLAEALQQQLHPFVASDETSDSSSDSNTSPAWTAFCGMAFMAVAMFHYFY